MGKIFIVRDTETNKEKVIGTDKDRVKYSTEETRKNFTQQKKKEDNKVVFRQYTEKELGEFVFIIYKMYENINRHEEILTSSDLTRLIYIATFVNFDSVLMETERTYMTKDKLKEKLKLSKNAFNTLYNKLIKLKILIEHDKFLYINPDYFFKGKIENHLPENHRCTMLFINNIRHLYEITSTKSHKTLSTLFRVIPYLNVEWNIVCKNPNERVSDLVEPMNLKELGDILDYSEKGIQKLKSELTQIKTLDNKHVIGFFTSDGNVNHYKIVISPKIIFQGSSYEKVEGFGIVF